jgi:hypothetical protein
MNQYENKIYCNLHIVRCTVEYVGVPIIPITSVLMYHILANKLLLLLLLLLLEGTLKVIAH